MRPRSTFSHAIAFPCLKHLTLVLALSRRPRPRPTTRFDSKAKNKMIGIETTCQELLEWEAVCSEMIVNQVDFLDEKFDLGSLKTDARVYLRLADYPSTDTLIYYLDLGFSALILPLTL